MHLEYVLDVHFPRDYAFSPLGKILSPQTCENFAQLAKRGYYNGVIFHRIIAVRLSFHETPGKGGGVWESF
jgi:hypothetical protein